MTLMRTILPCGILVVALSSLMAAESADVVFKHGNVYTLNEAKPRAEAVAVKQGRIVFVGSDVDAANSKAAHASLTSTERRWCRE